MKQRISLILLSLVSVLYCMAEDIFLPSWYEGRIHDAKVYDDTLFVAIDNGIYSYALKEQDAEWKPYAFNGMRILRFVKSSQKMMADYFPEQPQGEYKQQLLFSEDYGKTFNDITPTDAIFDPQGSRAFEFWQIPDSPDHFFLDIHGHNRTWTETKDFGVTWNDANTGDGNHGLFAIDPNDVTHILVYGPPPGSDVYGAYIYETTDNLQTLTRITVESEYASFMSMVFYPANSQILLATTNGGIVKSTDCGRSWKRVDNKEEKWYYWCNQVLFDSQHPQVAYAVRSEDIGGGLHAWEIYRSEDVGETWKTFYPPSFHLQGCVVKMFLYDNELVIVSEWGSICRVPTNGIPATITMQKQYTATHSNYVFDLQGRRLESQPEKGIYIQNGKKVVIK